MGLEKLPEILRCLHDEHVEYVVIGAVAMMVHGLVRGTEDLDFFVQPSATNIERLRAALRRVYPTDGSIDEISEADLLGEYPAVRYNTPDGSFGIDILTRLGEAFSYDDIEYQEAVFEKIPVPSERTPKRELEPHATRIDRPFEKPGLESPARRPAAAPRVDVTPPPFLEPIPPLQNIVLL